MKVFRVGHEKWTRRVDGMTIPAGPYNGVDWDLLSPDFMDMIDAHSGEGSERHHPAPYLCPELRYVDVDEVCGFNSLESLLSWFESWHALLDRNGFRIWVYEVPDGLARIGRFGQAVFFPSSATLVEDFPFPLGPVQLALF